jgi:AcrR family transcriptional regulator
MTRPAAAGAAEPAQPVRPMRADARRNYDRLLAAASTAFAEHGADASLEEVARQAGVGIGTLYRHFPTRAALLEASYLVQLDALCDRATALLGAPDPGAALVTWLYAFAEHNVRSRGLKEILAAAVREEGSPLSSCKTMLREAVGALLHRAQEAGTIRADVTPNELMRLVHAVFLTAELTDDTGQTDRLLSLLLDGMRRPAPGPAAV